LPAHRGVATLFITFCCYHRKKKRLLAGAAPFGFKGAAFAPTFFASSFYPKICFNSKT
jgi:hypothetical protein